MHSLNAVLLQFNGARRSLAEGLRVGSGISWLGWSPVQCQRALRRTQCSSLPENTLIPAWAASPLVLMVPLVTLSNWQKENGLVGRELNWSYLPGLDMHFHQLPPERTEAPSSGWKKKNRGKYEGACWFKNRVALGKHDFYNPSLYKPV